MADASLIPAFDLKVGGKSILTAKTMGLDLREILVSDSLGRLDEVSVRFKWSGQVQEELKKLAPHGKPFIAEIKQESKPGSWKTVRKIYGDIVELEFTRSAGGGENNVLLRGLGPMHKLKRSWQSKVYEAKKQGDVVSAIASAAGFSADAEGTGGSPQDYVQANIADATYLQHLVDENPGYVLRFEDGKKLRFVRSASVGGGEKIEIDWNHIGRMRLRHSLEGVVSAVTAMGYDPVKGKAVEGKAAAKDLMGISGKKKTAAHLVSKFGGKLTLDNLSTMQATQCKERAKAELQRRADQFVQGSVEAGFHPKARSGATLTVGGKDVPWPVKGAKFRVREVTHAFRFGEPPSTSLSFYSDSLPDK